MASLEKMIKDALTGPISKNTTKKIVEAAIKKGASASDISQLAANAGFNIPASEINAHIKAHKIENNLAKEGSKKDTYEPEVKKKSSKQKKFDAEQERIKKELEREEHLKKEEKVRKQREKEAAQKAQSKVQQTAKPTPQVQQTAKASQTTSSPQSSSSGRTRTEADLVRVSDFIREAMSDGVTTQAEVNEALALAEQFNVSPQRLSLMSRPAGGGAPLFSEQDIRDTISATNPNSPLLNFQFGQSDPINSALPGNTGGGYSPTNTGGGYSPTNTGGSSAPTAGNPNTGTPVPQATANPGNTNPQANSGPGFISGSGNGGGTPNASAPDWAQLEQANADYFNQIQNSIFNNPNITLADGSTQQTSFGDMPDFKSYVTSNQDLLNDFNGSENPFTSMEAFGKWHWENHGRFESGRQLPLSSPAAQGFLQPDVSVNLSPEEQAIYDTNQRSRSALAAMGEDQLGRINQSFNQEDVRSQLYDLDPAMDDSGLFNFSQDPSGFMPDQDYQFTPSKSDLRSYSQYDTQPGMEGFQDIRNDLIGREQYRFDRARDDLENDLLVRGLDPGTESWNRRMDDLNRAENDFSLAATGRAADIQGSLFGMENLAKNTQLGAQGTFSGIEQGQIGQQAQIGNSLFNMEGQRRQQDVSDQQRRYDIGRDYRQNQISEDAYFRNQPLNEYNALMGGTQIPMPSFSGYQGFATQTPDFAGAEQEQYNRNLYEQQRSDQKRNSLFNAFGSIGGSVLGAAGAAGGFSSLFG